MRLHVSSLASTPGRPILPCMGVAKKRLYEESCLPIAGDVRVRRRDGFSVRDSKTRNHVQAASRLPASHAQFKPLCAGRRLRSGRQVC